MDHWSDFLRHQHALSSQEAQCLSLLVFLNTHGGATVAQVIVLASSLSVNLPAADKSESHCGCKNVCFHGR